MMKNKYILLLFFALSVSTIHAQNSENSDDEAARTWSDKTGKFKVKAKLLSNAEGKIKLLKEDGLVITVPIDRLSEADQKFLNEKDNPFSGGEPLKNDMTEMDRKTGERRDRCIGITFEGRKRPRIAIRWQRTLCRQR